MGSFGSREVQTQAVDLAVPLIRLFVNFVFVGFILGLLIHEHDISIWSTYFDEHLNLWKYGRGIYFFWYTFTWYIVYMGFYVLVLEVILHPVLIIMVGYRNELHCELFMELLFGLWICGQILGSWVDWNRQMDCLKTHDCESYFMQNIMYMMESVCEYFTAYRYDPHKNVYFLRKHNYCYDIFHAAPAMFMTILSTSLAFLMIMIVQAK